MSIKLFDGRIYISSNDVHQLACQNSLFKALALGISGIAWHLKLEQMSLLHPDLYITWKKTFFFFLHKKYPSIMKSVSLIVLLPCQTILVGLYYLHLQLLWLIFSGMLNMCTLYTCITFNEKKIEKGISRIRKYKQEYIK